MQQARRREEFKSFAEVDDPIIGRRKKFGGGIVLPQTLNTIQQKVREFSPIIENVTSLINLTTEIDKEDEESNFIEYK
jgi:hypothetical protein